MTKLWSYEKFFSESPQIKRCLSKSLQDNQMRLREDDELSHNILKAKELTIFKNELTLGG